MHGQINLKVVYVHRQLLQYQYPLSLRHNGNLHVSLFSVDSNSFAWLFD